MMTLTYHEAYNAHYGKQLQIPDQYAQYYHKGIFESMHAGYLTYPYKVKSKSIIDYVHILESSKPKKLADPHMPFYRCLNSPYSTLKHIRENEKRAFYISEALIKTIPTKDLRQRLKALLVDLAPELAEVTFGQAKTVADNDEMFNTKIVDFIMTDDDEDMEIIPTFSLWIPMYEKDSKQSSFICKRIEDVIQNSGYEITHVDTLAVKHQPLTEPICVMLFEIEARYNDVEVSLADTMYHVTTLDVLDAIRKNGIVPQSRSKEFKYPDRVYLFNKAFVLSIEDYGCRKVIDTNVKDRKFCILQIDGKKLRESAEYVNGNIAFYADGSFAQAKTTDLAVFSYDAIPTKFIKKNVMVYEVDEFGGVKMTLNAQGKHVQDVKIIDF